MDFRNATHKTEEHTYIAIDLKSFYASVECVERSLNPLTTHLVVADSERTEKTICLAVSPSLKEYQIPGRARLFEVNQRVQEVNAERKRLAPNNTFTGSSFDTQKLNAHKELSLDFIIAKPRMAHYIEYSSRIYEIYLHYVSAEDIHVYSIDEVFMDVTHYLKTYKLSARELAQKIILHVLKDTGITATAGIAPNLYLCKVAMDIVAKHTQPDEHGVRIAELDELSYRKKLWSHRPLTDFWRVGRGYQKKLEENGLYTMGDIARCSLGSSTDFFNEDLLYKLFGVNAELLIDHAWGYEPTTISQIKAYKPENNSISSGQVLSCPYSAKDARLVVMEMADLMALDLLDKGMVTDQLVLTISYDRISLKNKTDASVETTTDFYGREIPKNAHGSKNLDSYTSSARLITKAATTLYDEIIMHDYWVRKIGLCANHIITEEKASDNSSYEQLSLFTTTESFAKQSEEDEKFLEKERKMQEAMLLVKKRYGKNAMLKGMNLQEGATTISRNKQIGGHNA